ncbi:hypothetical protein [Geobacillus sp. BK01]|uniref:hypothetical protein n=1 Tax=Geobacillus sp. BK01 TaxID=3457328 RepID=UPI003FA60A0A
MTEASLLSSLLPLTGERAPSLTGLLANSARAAFGMRRMRRLPFTRSLIAP